MGIATGPVLSQKRVVGSDFMVRNRFFKGSEGTGSEGTGMGKAGETTDLMVLYRL
jgi:hypothetical protein